MKNRYISGFLTALLLLCTNTDFAQMTGDCVFLKGRYVEVGIAPNGGYGSTLPAPVGYHPNNPLTGYTALYDPGSATSSASGSLIGFVADYGRDGWTIGAPPYFGDYYMPGFPQEGWAIKATGLGVSQAYIPSYIATGSTGFNTVWGAGAITGTNLSYVNTGTGISKGIWKGNFGDLAIRQTTVLDTNKLYFTVNVIMTNTSTTTPVTNIFYHRTLDPDNDVTSTSNFSTINTIAYQNDAQHRVLVSTTGATRTNAYLGLGTKDCRAKCVIFHDGTLTPDLSPDSLYNQQGVPILNYLYGVGQTDTQDVGVALVYNIGTIPPGDSTSLTYAYILNAAYIDTALDATRPTYTVNGVPFTTSATINLCHYGADTVFLAITGGDFYNWNWAPNTYISGTTGVANYVNSNLITSPMTYTITGVNKSGSCDSVFYYLTMDYDTFLVDVFDTVYCVGDVAAPLRTAPVPAGGFNLWSTSPSGGGTLVPPTPSTAVAGTFVYYVTQSFGGTCTSTPTPDTVLVMPIPLPPALYDPNPYCFGAPFITPTATGTAVKWYTTPTGGVGASFPPTLSTTIVGTDTIYATQTVNGCTSPRAALPITVLDSIHADFNVVKGYGCGADTAKITNLTIGALKYTWDFGDGFSDTVSNPKHIYTLQDTFKVVLTATNFVCDDTVSKTFSFFHPLNAYFRIIPDIACQNTPVKFADSSIGISRTHKWNFGDGSGVAFGSNPLYTYQKAGVYTVRHIVTDFVPCSDTETALIYVDSISKVSLNISDTTICQGTYVNLAANYSDIGNIGVTWDFGDGNSIENVNPVIHAFNAANVMTVTVTPHYRVCRDTTVRRQIVVFPIPLIDIGDDTSICAGSEAMTLRDRVNTGNTKAWWRWNTGETGSAVTIVAPGKYFTTVGVNGCTNSDTIWVKNDCYLDIPNVFTPNGDGLNDYFFPRELLTAGLISFKMDIYNRWGQMVFSTATLNGAGWDGRFNGILQPQGVFIYVIEAVFKDGQKEHHQGNVTLLR